MKRLRKFLKGLVVHASIFSLLQTTIVFSANAQMSQTTRDVLNAAQYGVGVWSQAENQRISLQAQLAQQTANATMLKNLGPNCPSTASSASTCQSTASKFFPECKLPPTQASLPQNVCSEKVSVIQQASAAVINRHAYEELAKAWVNHYDLQLNEASNSANATGLKCLNDKKKNLDSELTEMVNNITRLQDQLNQYKSTFQNNNQNLLKQLATANEELMGASGAGKNNLDLKTKTFASYFDPSCQTIIGEENIANGAQIGLNGIKNSLIPAGTRASNYTSTNRAQITNELDTDISKIQNSISTNGLQNYFDGKIADTSKYKGLVSATQKQATEFKIARERIESELGELGYTIPKMGTNFKTDISKAISTSGSYLKNRYLNSCMTNSSDSTVGKLSTEELLKAISQQSTNNEGTAITNYKNALLEILKSNTYDASTKLTKIKALEDQYKGITISYNGSGGSNVTQSVSGYYTTLMSKCETRYNDDTSSGGASTAERVSRAQGLLKELQSLHTNYSAELANRVKEQVLSCNGESKKAGASCGDADSFDFTSASFCISHADQCANEVAACVSKATQLVDQKKATMKAAAAAYNTNADNLRKQVNAIYNNQKSNIMAVIKKVQDRFPGTNFAIPENMTIDELSFKSDTYGVELANDGSLSFIDNYSKKMDLLKKMFKEQQNKVDDEIGDYISKQMAAMQSQKSRWNELANQCRESADQIQKDVAKYNAEGTKTQNEQDAKVASFCRKYSDLRSHPIGACEDTKDLAENVDKIASRISNSALAYTASYRNVCNQYNNENDNVVEMECIDFSWKDLTEKEKREEDNKKKRRKCAAYEKRIAAESSSKASSRLSINSLCPENKTEDKDFIKSIAKYASDSDRSVLEGVNDLKDISSSKLEALEGSYDIIQYAKDLKKKNEGNICAQLLKIDNSAKDNTAVAEAKSRIEAEETEYAEEKARIEQTFTAVLKNEPDDKIIIGNRDRELKTLEEKYNKKIADYKKIIAADRSASEAEALRQKIKGIVPVYTQKDLREQAISRIGEQFDTSCDTQAMNNMVGKTLGIQDEINSFDNSRRAKVNSR